MSVFSDEWRKCLREQYKHVARNDDKVTEKSLTPLLQELGFGEDELKQLYIQATMHTDNVPEDFQPDLTLLNEQPTDPMLMQPHPAECSCPDCMAAVDETIHDDEGQLLSEDEIEEVREREAHENIDDDKPKQMSMF